MRILRKMGTGILILVGIALIVAVGYGIFLLLSAALRRTAALNETVVAAFVASLTIVLGYWYIQYRSTSREIVEARRPQKIELYRTLTDVLQDLIQSSLKRETAAIDPKKLSKSMQKRFWECNRDLIVWGSPSMIDTWLKFRYEASFATSGEQVFLLMDNVLRSIREDLGNSNFGLHNGDLVSLLFKDQEDLHRLIELHWEE